MHCACDPVPNETNGPPPTGQVPFQVCPEMLNKPKKQCSECGGSNNGVCKNILLNGPQTGCLPPGCGFFCQCDGGSGGNGNSPTTQLVTSVVNGKTVTGTFTPTTLSQYASLRASTTITTSEKGHETALVVLAGGVAWALASKWWMDHSHCQALNHRNRLGRTGGRWSRSNRRWAARAGRF